MPGVTTTDRLLMGPGPSNPYPEAMAGLARPVLGHMDPEFIQVLDETMERLRTVFRTENALTLPISGTGSAGMEACFVNLLEPGDTAIVGANGVFGDRMCEVARALRRRGRAHRGGVGPGARPAAPPRRAARAPRRAPRRRRARGDEHRRRERPSRRCARSRTPTRCSCSTPSRRSGGSRWRSTPGVSTPRTRARRSASACRPGCRRSRSRPARWSASRRDPRPRRAGTSTSR